MDTPPRQLPWGGVFFFEYEMPGEFQSGEKAKGTLKREL